MIPVEFKIILSEGVLKIYDRFIFRRKISDLVDEILGFGE